MLRSTKKHKPRSGSSRSSSSREDLFRSHSPSPGSGRSTPSSLDDLRQSSPSKEAYASPDRRSIASISTGSMTPSSTIEALATPSLPMVVCVKVCSLVKSPPGSAAGGWGFVLRGTTSEYKQGTKVYTCHVDSVKADGAAMIAGIREGDQIVSIDDKIVRDLEHTDVVKMFQSSDKLKLTILPAKFKDSSHVRVTEFNYPSLNFVWALTMTLQSLEIVNVQLCGQEVVLASVDFSSLLSLRHLSLNHCGLESFNPLTGLRALHRLESLSLAHNFLSVEALDKDCPISSLGALRRLDLSSNVLNAVPLAVLKLSSLETLVVVDNNITELPVSLKKLTKLTTLCIDGNLLSDVDATLEQIHQLKMVTLSDNQLETEPQCIKHQAYVITCVEGNPYLNGMSGMQEPLLKRTLSVRGVLKNSLCDNGRRKSAILGESLMPIELISPIGSQ